MEATFGFPKNNFKRKIKRMESGGRKNWTPILGNRKVIKKILHRKEMGKYNRARS